jgi:hypothetical protein
MKDKTLNDAKCGVIRNLLFNCCDTVVASDGSPENTWLVHRLSARDVLEIICMSVDGTGCFFIVS